MCKVEGTHYWQRSSWKQNISYLNIILVYSVWKKLIWLNHTPIYYRQNDSILILHTMLKSFNSYFTHHAQIIQFLFYRLHLAQIIHFGKNVKPNRHDKIANISLDLHTFIAQNIQKFHFQCRLTHFPLLKCLLSSFKGKSVIFCRIWTEKWRLYSTFFPSLLIYTPCSDYTILIYTPCSDYTILMYTPCSDYTILIYTHCSDYTILIYTPCSDYTIFILSCNKPQGKLTGYRF